MEFNSFAYAIFLALTIALYYAPFMRSAWKQNMLVLAGSYIFYGAWNWRFLGLVILTTLSTWLCAIAIGKWHKKIFLIVNVALNLGVLCVFKYFNYFAENIVWLLKWMGWEVDWVFLEILLPVGISFYTFQAIGYTVDVWRRRIEPTRNLLLFSTFIAYFPQLVAGPIERAEKLLPQLNKIHRWSYPMAVEGMRLILWGMFKKVAVADPCGTVVDSWLSADASDACGLKIWLAAMLFAIQIYCDFSGYCDIAQGSARMLGVELMDNFKRPFFSRSFTELWSRWHVSLMNWFRDYVYIPLGGSRKGKWRVMLNIMTVFLLSGLWHGAHWNFVLWGGLCGILCIIERLLGVKSYKNAPSAAKGDVARMFLTFSMFTVCVTVFRVPDVGKALWWAAAYVVPFSIAGYAVVLACTKLVGRIGCSQPVSALLSFRNVMVTVLICFGLCAVIKPGTAWFHLYYALAVIVFACEWHTRHGSLCGFPLSTSPMARRCVYLMLYLAIMAYGFFQLPPMGEETQFIYFQF